MKLINKFVLCFINFNLMEPALDLRVVHLLASSQLAGGFWATGGMASGKQMHRAPMSRVGGLL